MSSYEVPEPILNSPFEEPAEHWHIEEGAFPSSGRNGKYLPYAFTEQGVAMLSSVPHSKRAV